MRYLTVGRNVGNNIYAVFLPHSNSKMKITSKNIDLLPDGRHTIEPNLHVWVKGNRKTFVFRYQFAGRRRDLSLGAHPTVTVTTARQEAAKCRALLARGISPHDVREENKQNYERAAVKVRDYVYHTLEVVTKLRRLRPQSIVSWETAIKNYIVPVLGNQSVAKLTVQDVVKLLDPIWETKNPTACKSRGILEIMITLAKREGIFVGENPAIWKANLDTFFAPSGTVRINKHRAAFSVPDLVEFVQWCSLRQYNVYRAIIFCALTACRQVEFRNAKWEHIDFANRIWIIPPENRKDRVNEPFRVPLSDQAIALLKLQNTNSTYVFPGSVFGTEDTFLSIGYPRMVISKYSNGTVTLHGCRSTFRDWCAREEVDRVLAEKSLMHSLGQVEAAYQRDDLLELRRPLMQKWADVIAPLEMIRQMPPVPRKCSK